jgi:hypothetical protein
MRTPYAGALLQFVQPTGGWRMCPDVQKETFPARAVVSSTNGRLLPVTDTECTCDARRA